jgi:hypothetical protein
MKGRAFLSVDPKFKTVATRHSLTLNSTKPSKKEIELEFTLVVPLLS